MGLAARPVNSCILSQKAGEEPSFGLSCLPRRAYSISSFPTGFRGFGVRRIHSVDANNFFYDSKPGEPPWQKQRQKQGTFVPTAARNT